VSASGCEDRWGLFVLWEEFLWEPSVAGTSYLVSLSRLLSVLWLQELIFRVFLVSTCKHVVMPLTQLTRRNSKRRRHQPERSHQPRCLSILHHPAQSPWPRYHLFSGPPLQRHVHHPQSARRTSNPAIRYTVVFHLASPTLIRLFSHTKGIHHRWTRTSRLLVIVWHIMSPSGCGLWTCLASHCMCFPVLYRIYRCAIISRIE
jgi:hypothetical protein